MKILKLPKVKNLLNENKNIYNKNYNNENKINKENKIISKNNENKNTENNFIVAEINIKENDVDRKIRILNSYEETLRANPSWKKHEDYKNEEEIKKILIKINHELIPFNYLYEFKSKGKYIIKYSFKNILKNTFLCFMNAHL